jgi:polyisoprenyl-phosphate glycosyltransferase
MSPLTPEVPVSSPITQAVCIVVPCYNEANAIGLFYKELRAELERYPAQNLRFSVLFVDDGSSDATLGILNDIAAHEPSVIVLSLSRNFGHQIALSAGLDHANADAVILMDSDLQHPPALIPKMIQLWEQGFDVVSAVRNRTADASAMKSITTASFYALFNFFSDTKIVAGAADFCLLSRRAYETIRSMPERHRFLRGMVSWIGFGRATIPYAAPARAAGISKYNAAKMIRLASDAVFSFSAAPIRIAARVGVLAVALAAVYFVFIMIRFLFYGDTVQGWPSLIVVVLSLGGFQLLFIGLIGEYLARIFEESKGRPLYVLKQGYSGESLATNSSPGDNASAGENEDRQCARSPLRN